MLYSVCTFVGFLAGIALTYLTMRHENARAWDIAQRAVDDAAEFWHAETIAAMSKNN